MLQLNNVNQIGVTRTFRPTYALTQATPKSGFLDPNWNRSVPIWPGMVLMRTLGVAYAENADSYASTTTTITSGSNGVNVNTFTGSGTLNVAANGTFAATGDITVVTSTGTAVLSYTGNTGTTFTGVNTIYGTGTLSTGGSVSQATDIISPPTYLQTGFPSGAESAYTLINGTGVPAGFCGQYIGGEGIDELLFSGVNALACWVLGPDAECEILAPAFDPSLAWATVDPGTGIDILVYARTANLSTVTGANGLAGALGTTGLQGQLCLSTDTSPSTQPVGRLISVNSATSITVGGLIPRHSF